MSINTESIEQLVFKFNTGTISPAELQLLQDWYNNHDDAQVTITTKTDESNDQVKSRMLENLLAKIVPVKPQPVKQQKLWPRLSVAAAAVAAIAVGVWFYNYELASSRKASRNDTIVMNEIAPGTSKATLTLQDGRNITLSSAQTGIVTGNEITYANGTPVENARLDETSETQKLTLHTPRGGTYTITLPDGTQVWLNAASTIKYPSRFSAATREVELEGEAYFQVKSIYNQQGKKIPFKVISKQQQVEVLGTQFNMNTYTDQPFSKTTLVEGKVAISDKNNHFVLAPNDQAVTTSTGKTTVKQVDAGNYTAWRDGKFSFDGKTFEENMNDIARWYDLNVLYENGIPEEELIGDAYRNQNIRFVLRFLRSAEIDYKLDIANRKLTIKGKKNRM